MQSAYTGQKKREMCTHTKTNTKKLKTKMEVKISNTGGRGHPLSLAEKQPSGRGDFYKKKRSSAKIFEKREIQREIL